MHTTVELFVPKRASVSHSFLHFTIQEYLAAVRISQMSPKEIMELLEPVSLHWNPSELMKLYYFFGHSECYG